jgi:hypothetical protein
MSFSNRGLLFVVERPLLRTFLSSCLKVWDMCQTRSTMVICRESFVGSQLPLSWRHEPKHDNENENHEHENYYNRWIGSLFFACLFVWI